MTVAKENRFLFNFQKLTVMKICRSASIPKYVGKYMVYFCKMARSHMLKKKMLYLHMERTISFIWDPEPD